MDAFNTHLKTKFQLLQNSDLVSKKIISSTSIAEFNTILNEAIPTNDYGKAIGEFVRFMYRYDRSSFYRYIQNGLNHLVLLTDGGPIINVLGINKSVTIRYQLITHEFLVRFDQSTDVTRAISMINNTESNDCNDNRKRGNDNRKRGNDNRPNGDNRTRGNDNRIRGNDNRMRGNDNRTNGDNQPGYNKYPNTCHKERNNHVDHSNKNQIPHLSMDKYVGMMSDAKKIIEVKEPVTKTIQQRLMELDWVCDDIDCNDTI